MPNEEMNAGTVTAEPAAAEPATVEPVAAEPVTAEPVTSEPVAASGGAPQEAAAAEGVAAAAPVESQQFNASAPVTPNNNAVADEQKAAKKTPVAAVIMLVAAVLIAVAGIVVIIKSRAVVGAYDGKNWYEEDVDAPKLPVVESFTDSENGEDSIADEWVYGNSITNYGIACDDDAYYYADPSADNKIYRIEKSSPYTRTKISDLAGSNLSVMNGRVYFISTDYSENYAPGIYSVGTDGEDPEFLMEGMFSDLTLVNDWVYYIRDNDNAICKFQINDRKEIVLCEEECLYFQIKENTIYFMANLEKDDSEDKEKTFCCMDVNGGNMIRILTQDRINTIVDESDDESYESSEWPDLLAWDPGFDLNTFMTNGDSVYLVSWNEGMIEIKMSDISANISPDLIMTGFRYIKGIYSYPYFYGDYIIFKYMEDDGKLIGLKSDGTSVTIIDTGTISDIDYCDDLVITEWVDDSSNARISANDLRTGESLDIFSD
ncbi:MAG: DUF5050 domain-containing protein [Lachnospiraceae bacterium]|nr:DUF5050 domain-containing protein [Lachnospiraceae bacterium]